MLSFEVLVLIALVWFVPTAILALVATWFLKRKLTTRPPMCDCATCRELRHAGQALADAIDKQILFEVTTGTKHVHAQHDDSPSTIP